MPGTMGSLLVSVPRPSCREPFYTRGGAVALLEALSHQRQHYRFLVNHRNDRKALSRNSVSVGLFYILLRNIEKKKTLFCSPFTAFIWDCLLFFFFPQTRSHYIAWLSWQSLCRPDRPQMQQRPAYLYPPSAGLKACATVPGPTWDF